MVTEHPATMAAIFVQTTTPADSDHPNRGVLAGDIWLDTSGATPVLRKCTSIGPITFAGLVIGDGGTGLTANPVIDMFVSATAMKGLATAGAGDSSQLPESRELATNDVNVDYIAFDPSTEEHAFFWFAFPNGWDEGTITGRFHWTGAAGAGGVTWGIAGLAFSNDDAMDAALGTEVEVDDTFLAADDQHVSAESAAITIGGTPAAGDLCYFVVARKVGNANDTKAEDAQLMGVKLKFTKDSYTDA